MLFGLHTKYAINENDDEISLMSREKWKSSQKRFTITCLGTWTARTSHLPAHKSIQTQEYFEFLWPADARLYVVGHWTWRPYVSTTTTKTIDRVDETIEHIVNNCVKVKRTEEFHNVFSLSEEDAKVIARTKQFISSAEELNCQKTPHVEDKTQRTYLQHKNSAVLVSITLKEETFAVSRF